MQNKIKVLNGDLLSGRIDLGHYAILARQMLGAIHDVNRRVKWANMLFVTA